MGGVLVYGSCGSFYGVSVVSAEDPVAEAEVAFEVPSKFEPVVKDWCCVQDCSDHAETSHGSEIEVGKLPTQVMDLVSERADGCEGLEFKSSVSLPDPESSPLPATTSPTCTNNIL